ncbi:MAG: hypothetical protein M0P00_03665 [Bacteroidaceae bacterium]|nr:hypothetical protein [Bacteroidaceae bacterium]
MKTLKFKCSLLTDVIINQNAATVGNQASLDFIPGSNFLGIAAGKLYESVSPEDAAVMFHSGKVRFGDAHPAYDSLRSLRVPSAMFYPKLMTPKEMCFISPYYEREKDTLQDGHPYQLKQCRNGFYAFLDNHGIEQKVEKTFAIKSAYDANTRRSKDKQMYGYQSIDKDLNFFFEIAIDDEVPDNLSSLIKDAIVGTNCVGRSRTAQYGLVSISMCDYEDVPSGNAQGDLVLIYADSRLIFLDEYGLPTFQPTAQQLGVDGKIDWFKSQIRTFQYAPWNSTRQSRDMDRCGIEKGSVFVVKKGTKHVPAESQYVGLYQNEGFGKVIYNPDFLKADSNENGKALFTLVDLPKKEKEKVPPIIPNDLLRKYPLLNFLENSKKKEDEITKVYKAVNDFVKKEGKYFFLQGQADEAFASQWGKIRSIAMQCKTKGELLMELFDKRRMKGQESLPDAYLTHGVAEEKWEERGRKDMLKDFIENITKEYVQLAVINLAAEMAKKCRRENDGR